MRWLLVLLVLSVGCCAGHPEVENAVKDGIAVNTGHMLDEKLPAEANCIAEDNLVFLYQIRYGLTGEAIPSEIQKIIDDRKGGPK